MDEISISSVFHIILHKLWAIVLSAVLCGTAAFTYCNFFETPVYQAKASIIVTNGAVINDSINSTVSNTDLAASIYLVDTCVDILKSSKIYQELSTSISDKYSYKVLRNGFSVSRRSDDSLFIDITFKSTSRSEAVEIVNAFAELSSGYICEVIPSATVAVMERSDSADVVSPRTAFTTLLFILLGAMGASLVFIILNSLDKAINDEEDFKAKFNIPVLGTVPDFKTPSSHTRKKSSGGY